jgi:glycosyltransferase involved in cell wall biosynthesis
VAGGGSMAKQLARSAFSPVEFLGEVSNNRLRELYRGCRALVFPGREDFGMVMVEAQACGRPVVCFGEGGAREAVVAGITGQFFYQQSESALRNAIEEFEAAPWDAARIRAQALRFSSDRFREAILRVLTSRTALRWNPGMTAQAAGPPHF